MSNNIGQLNTVSSLQKMQAMQMVKQNNDQIVSAKQNEFVATNRLMINPTAHQVATVGSAIVPRKMLKTQSDEQLGQAISSAKSNKFSLANLFGISVLADKDTEMDVLDAVTNSRIDGYFSQSDAIEGVDADEVGGSGEIDELGNVKEDYDDYSDYVELRAYDNNEDVWVNPDMRPIRKVDAETVELSKARQEAKAPIFVKLLNDLNKVDSLNAASGAITNPSIFSGMAERPLTSGPRMDVFQIPIVQDTALFG